MSGSASGSFGKAIVAFGWKGIAVARKWVKPSNPKGDDQGDVRMVLGGLGKATRCMELNSLYRNDALLVSPSNQTWVSAFVQHIAKNYMMESPMTGTKFEAEYSAYAATQKSIFDAGAATLLLADFDITYKGTTHAFTAGLQLYEIAKYAIAKRGAVEGAFERAPYTTAIGSWDADDVAALVADLQAV